MDRGYEFPKFQAGWAVEEFMRVSFWCKRDEKVVFFFFSPLEELASDSGWLSRAGQDHPCTLPDTSPSFLRPVAENSMTEAVWLALVTPGGQS